jgi:hypothetical protein
VSAIDSEVMMIPKIPAASRLGAALLLAWLATACMVSVARVETAPRPSLRLGVSPMLVDAAAEVWGVIARADNPVWPGWNASDTPLLLYLPGKQDLLINHPHPPEGFVPYAGPLTFPGAKMWVKDGPTIVSADGQNTSMDVAGVTTLVVADPLSNLRQQIGSLLEDERPGTEKARALALEDLAPDPYGQLTFVVHEAFHVYQSKTAPRREANESSLLAYPVLSIENNVGFGLEAEALAEAIGAADPGSMRRAAVRWLALRRQRRAGLPIRAIQYEDGVEFSEGLAKYTEYRLLEVLEGRVPSPGLARTQGFSGYADLAPRRAALLAEMKRQLRGEVNVNNSPYGAAPLRMRLYYSGLAIGVLLDRLDPHWKETLWASDSSITSIARDVLKAGEDELAAGLRAADADTARATLVAAKTRLAEEGRKRIEARLAALDQGPGTTLVVSYGGLSSTRVGLGFTPFGITRVDADRIFFEQIPISVRFADGSKLEEQIAMPLLRDTKKYELRLRLEKRVTAADLARLAGASAGSASVPRPTKLELPGVTLDLMSATLALAGNTIRVTLHPTTGTTPPK